MKLVLVQPLLSYSPGFQNLDEVRGVVMPFAPELGADDVVLLPEHFDLRPSRREYEDGVRGLARSLGCNVVGGSHHEDRDGGRVNSGVVADARGFLVGSYEKVRPYATERTLVADGSAFGELTIGGHAILVLICADFWFSDLILRASRLPDVILVPALSVTRKPTPDYSRALWRHLCVARAYEFGAYVGVSDWAHAPTPGHLFASGVAGLADPTVTDPDGFFRPVGKSAQLYDLDFTALEEFRKDRLGRGFFWKRP